MSDGRGRLTDPAAAASQLHEGGKRKAEGSVLIAPGVLGWLRPSGAARTTINVHLAQRIIVPLDGSALSFRTPEGAIVETRSPLLVPPGIPYATLSAAPRLGLIMHPVRDGRRVLVTTAGPTVLEGRIADHVRGAAEALVATRPGTDAGDAHGELLRALGSPLGKLLDRRVRGVLETLATAGSGLPTLDVLSAQSGLSPDRLRHLVVESLGFGLRRLAQWYRFTNALQRMSQAERLAQIAADTGFSDQAHLARTARKLLGHPPSLRTAIDWRIYGNYLLV